MIITPGPRRINAQRRTHASTRRTGTQRHSRCQRCLRRGLRRLLDQLGFDERVRGSHHIFTKSGVEEILNLQPKGRSAKPYQVKQVRAVVVKYRLAGEDSDADELEVRDHHVIMYWSDEDEAYIAEVPELPGCAADGASYQQALANVETVIEEWIQTAQELGREIPEPRGRLMYA